MSTPASACLQFTQPICTPCTLIVLDRVHIWSSRLACTAASNPQHLLNKLHIFLQQHLPILPAKTWSTWCCRVQRTATTTSPGLEALMHTRHVTWLIGLLLMWAAAPAPATPPAPPPPHPPLTLPSQTSPTHAQTAARLLPVLLSVTSWTGAIPSATAAPPTAPAHRCVLANFDTKHMNLLLIVPG